MTKIKENLKPFKLTYREINNELTKGLVLITFPFKNDLDTWKIFKVNADLSVSQLVQRSESIQWVSANRLRLHDICVNGTKGLGMLIDPYLKSEDGHVYDELLVIGATLESIRKVLKDVTK